MHLSFEILIDYFVNRFIIPFISAFIGFIIRNVNATIKHTGRFGKFKTAFASSILVAILAGAILQYVNFDISIVICLSVLSGTCGAEILDALSKPSIVKLIFVAIFKKTGAGSNFILDIIDNKDKSKNKEKSDSDAPPIEEKKDDGDDEEKNDSS